MRKAGLIGLAWVCGAGAAWGQSSPGEAERRAAVEAAGCEASKDASIDVAPWAGATEPDLRVVTVLPSALEGADDSTLGELCVSLVREREGRFALVSGLSDPVEPTAHVSPVSNDEAGVEHTAFRYRPGEVALGVRVGDAFNSTSTNGSYEALYLFRRVGDRLEPIFHADVADVVLDKTSGRSDPDRTWVVRFDDRLTHGAYDLILARKGRREGERYSWNGTRYVKAAKPKGR